MVLKATSKLYKHSVGKTMYIAIPSDIVQDSQFPFNRKGEEITMSIDKNTIIISKREVN